MHRVTLYDLLFQSSQKRGSFVSTPALPPRVTRPWSVRDEISIVPAIAGGSVARSADALSRGDRRLNDRRNLMATYIVAIAGSQGAEDGGRNDCKST